MLTVATARRLRDAGLTWSPASGDRFVVADRGMDEEIFVISQMVIEHHLAPTGWLLRFNGTTEWALDNLRWSRRCGCRARISSGQPSASSSCR